jgi:hypothetical protein
LAVGDFVIYFGIFNRHDSVPAELAGRVFIKELLFDGVGENPG